VAHSTVIRSLTLAPEIGALGVNSTPVFRADARLSTSLTAFGTWR